MEKILLIAANYKPSGCGISDYCNKIKVNLEKIGAECDILDVTHSGFSKKYSLISPSVSQIWVNFTPLMYAKTQREAKILITKLRDFQGEKKLILHEAPFFDWQYPKSIVNGVRELFVLRQFSVIKWSKVITSSDHIVKNYAFLFKENKICQVNIGSNICFSERQIDASDIESKYGIIFGGGNNLYWSQKFIDRVESRLAGKDIEFSWKILGGVDQKQITFKLASKHYGYLGNNEISFLFRNADFFFVPHYTGMCAKRGTVVTAMQHSLPVIGTDGYMTDNFWVDVKGVHLYKLNKSHECADKIYEVLTNTEYKSMLGAANQLYYQKNMSWQAIVNQLI